METSSTLNVELDLQNPNNVEALPTLSEMKTWCAAAIQSESHQKAFESTLSVLVRVVDSDESAELNQQYRDKQGATNVLSFPNQVPEFMASIPELSEQNSHLGDLVICESLVKQEATEQDKSVGSHWAHLIIHGVLHLQGFDHIDDTEALEMETLEIQILEQLGFANPYTKPYIKPYIKQR